MKKIKTKANSTFKLKNVLPCSYEDMTSIRRVNRKIHKLISDILFEQILSELYIDPAISIRRLTRDDLQAKKEFNTH